MNRKTSQNTTIILGAGAAGFFTAINTKQNSPNDSIIIIEKSKQILSKVKISGGGRCNVTHACFDPKTLCDYYPRGAKELRGPFQTFSPQHTMEWFEARGVKLKIEADNRVFPCSDNSQTIIDCLVNEAQKLGVKVWTECAVTEIKKAEEGFQLSLNNGTTQTCDKLILATGSSRGGYEIAKSLGHRIIDPVPSLFTFKINDKHLHKLQGLSVSETEVWLSGQKKQSQTGPLLITHWGMSGPSIIKLSAWKARKLFDCHYQVNIGVNWLRDLSEEDIANRLRKNKGNHPKKQVTTQSPFPQLPQRLWGYLITKAGLSSSQNWGGVSEKQKLRLIQELVRGEYDVTGKGVFKEEFVTCGGVDLKEVNFKNMESKVCPGLHLVGEILNCDGVTGGFNFQNAWTTGFLVK